MTLSVALLDALLLRPRINVNITLFSHVTLTGKVQSTSDLDYFHALDLPRSRVKSHNDPISEEIAHKGFLHIYRYVMRKFEIYLQHLANWHSVTGWQAYSLPYNVKLNWYKLLFTTVPLSRLWFIVTVDTTVTSVTTFLFKMVMKHYSIDNQRRRSERR